MSRGRLLVLVLAAAIAGAFAPNAFGAVLLGRNPSHVKLLVTPDGKALVRYRQGGSEQTVIAWGAINARPHPTCGKIQGPPCGPRQVQMQHLRLHSSGRLYKQIFKQHNTCPAYDGPQLEYLVAACKAKDGSYWAVQVWARLQRPCARDTKGARELRLSHWSGPLPKLTLYQSWLRQKGVYRHHIWGQYTYRGKPIYGLKWNHVGVPEDGYGRVVHLKVFNPRCGKGWRLLEGVLSKFWWGQFCRTTWLNAAVRQGEQYRAIAEGPGVMPDIAAGPIVAQPFNQDWEWQAYQMQLKLSRGSKFCKPQPTPWIHVNEVLTGTVGHPDDQFVELVNNGNTYAHIGGYKLVYRGATATSDTVLATVPAGRTLGVGKYYLFARHGYVGPVTPNQWFSLPLSPLAGGVGLRDDQGNLLDSVGYGPGVTNGLVEGTVAAAASIISLPGETISRIPDATDTNDNSKDFAITPPTPGSKNHTGSLISDVWTSLAAAWRHLIL